MDVYDNTVRSGVMRKVKSVNTGAELAVRRLIHRAGYRFRMHASDLPGRPDLVFRSRRKVVLVHGCFWHQHHNCERAAKPTSNTAYWDAKLARNVIRDTSVLEALANLGWCAMVVWECEIKDQDVLLQKLIEFLR